MESKRRILNVIFDSGISCLLPTKLFLKMKYKIRVGKKLDLKNPQTFNEKLQWLKIYNRNPEYTIMVDKYESKKYISEKIGAALTVMEGGEHWFHTDVQMRFLDNWISNSLNQV